MESRKRVYDYDDDAPPKRHQAEDRGHVSRRPADSRSPSPPVHPPRSRSLSPDGLPPPKSYPRRGSPRHRDRSYSPVATNGAGNGSDRGGGSVGKICHFWKSYDNCRYGPNCRYAHSMTGEKGRESPSPLINDGPRRNSDLPKQYRLSPDSEFHPPGGRRDHPSGGFDKRGPPRGGSSDRGPPMRRQNRGPRNSRSPPPPGSIPTVCHFWKTNDSCKFGDKCRFLHSFPPPEHFPPRREMGPPRGRRERSFSPGPGGFARRPPGSPGRGGESRPIVWRHDVSPRYQRFENAEPGRYERNFSPPPRFPRNFSPPRRERSFSPRRYERGMSPAREYWYGYYSPPPRDRGFSPNHDRNFSPPPPPQRRMSPRFERGYSPNRYDGYPSPPRRQRSFSPPSQYRGQQGGGGGGGPPRPKNELCYFFTQKSGCRYADQCRYIHAKPEGGGRASPPSRAGSTPDHRD